VESREFLDLFVAEAREHLEGLSGLLTRARTDTLPSESIHDLFRHAHSLKGMALSLGLRPIAVLSHALEDILHDWRKGAVQPSPARLGTMLQVADRLATQVDAVAAGADPPAAGDLVALLRGTAAGEAPGPVTLSAGAPTDPAPTEPQPTPAAGPPPVEGSDPVLSLEVLLSRNAQLPAARALVVLKRLAEHGHLRRVDPPAEALSGGGFAGRMEVDLETRVGPERLAGIVQGLPDVATCRILSTSVASPPEPERRAGAERRTGTDRRTLDEEIPPGAVRESPSARTDAIPTIRVATERMDRLLDRIGELILERERLVRAVAPEPGSTAASLFEDLGRTIAGLRDDVMKMRLIPFAAIVPRLQRAVRDLSVRLEKPVDLRCEGTAVSLDRSILEELIDPLEHLLRNAIDHGIEAAGGRRERGKPAGGRITIALARQEERTTLTVTDDGRGMDPAALRRVAIERRFITREAAARLSDEEALMLVTLPGFSTASRTTDISGRGVGMDVVRMRVQKIGGRLTIRSEVGHGTTLEIEIPPSLTVTRAFLCRAAGDLYAVPVAAVHATLDVGRASIEASQGDQVTRRQDNEIVTLLPLASTLGAAGSTLPDPFPALMYRVGTRAYALAVDEILGEQEIVVKPLRHPLELLPQYAGAAVLDDGRIALILDPVNLTRTARPA